MTRRAALAGLLLLGAGPGLGQPQRKGSAVYTAVLEKPAVLEIEQKSGGLRETVQRQQELVWRLKERQEDKAFRISNMAIALIRSETGGQVKMTFSCNVESMGFSSADDVRLHLIARSRGGAALHTWTVGVPVRCAEAAQTPTPQGQDLPDDIAGNVFTSITAVEVAEATQGDGVRLERCGRS
jgi:hypothetical protein